MRWFASLLVTFGFLMLGLAAAQSAETETVRARGWVHSDEGFARLVFDWATPVGYRVSLEGDKLTVAFDRPAVFTLDRALGLLKPYIAGLDAESGERRLVFDLTQRWKLRHFTDGPKVAIDLIGAAPEAKPTPPAPVDSLAETTPVLVGTAKPATATLPQALPVPSVPAPGAPAPGAPVSSAPVPSAPPPAAQATAMPTDLLPETRASAEASTMPPPTVRLRVGQHDGFGRLVFDWPREVPYRILREGDSATISFDAPARLALDGAANRLPAPVKDFTAATDQEHPSLTLSLEPGTVIKDFRDGPRIVLDLRRDPLAAASPMEPVAQQAALPVETPAPARAGAEAAPAMAPTDASAAAETAPVETPPANDATTPDIAASEPPEPATAPPALPHPDPRKALQPNAMTAAEFMSGSDPASAPAAAPAGSPAATPGAGDFDAAAPAMAIGAKAVGEGIELRLPWSEPTRLALFRRAGALWLVFDRPARFDLAALGALEIPGLRAQSVAGGGAALRLVGLDRLGAAPRQQGTAWIIELQPRAEAAASELAVLPFAPAEGGMPVPTLMLRTAAPGPVLRLADPEVGDEIMVVPVAKAGEGVLAPVTWPAFRILPTIQGIAVELSGDGVEIAALDDGVTLGLAATARAFGPADTASGTALEEGEATEETTLAAIPAVDRLFDLPAWRLEDRGAFASVEAGLNRAVIEAPEADRDLPRVALARFYFAHDRSAEAAGLVDLVLHDRKSAADDPELLLISAAAKILMGEIDSARPLLAAPVLNGEVEAEPWRGMIAAADGHWEGAASDFVAAPTLLADYPPAMRTALGQQAAEAAIRTLDTVGATEWVERLKGEAPDAAAADHVLYLEGLLARVEGRTAEARDAWEKAAQCRDPETRARAQFGLADLLLETQAIDGADAIPELEALRFGWHDDGLEFDILHRLAGLYLDAGRLRDGLGLMRQLVADHPDHPGTPAILAAMDKAFRGAFDTAGDSPTTPFEALALHDEFPELTPTGVAGDRILQGLAERFVQIDLLDRAAALLDEQVSHRLTGAEKARVGARLAVIRLMDNRPEAAITALAKSDGADLDPALAGDRRRLEAEALAELGRVPDALALIAPDRDPEAAKLRVRIYWRAKEWAAAAAAIGTLLADAEPEQITAEEARRVKSAAVALTLADDSAGLAALKQRFGPAMAETPDAAAFQLLTGDLATTDSAGLAARLAGVGRLEGFLTDYRQRFLASPSGDGTQEAALPVAEPAAN
ncbi:MAG: hypothetical protein AB7V53_06855 [Dongiaceae bacterium]